MASLRCLVTGGAGFVGSHLVDRLIGDGHRVTAIDNFYTGSRSSIAHLAREPRFELVEHNVIEPWPALGDFDWVYNLACPASPSQYQRDPIFTMSSCFFGALRSLELAARCGARVLQASTSEVYGDPQEHPQSESYRGSVNPVGTRACYDEGKRAAETLCADFHRSGRVDTRIARLFNTYGPRMAIEDGRVVSNFMVQAIGQRPLTVYGDGLQTRSFCYVDDLVDGLVRLMRVDRAPLVMNLGNDEERSMVELAQAILRISGSSSLLVRRPAPPDDPVRRRPDLRLAREHLAYKPRFSLEEGLARTHAYFVDALAE